MQLAVELLLEASLRTKCNVAVRIRALVLYHHFMRCSSQKSVLGHNDVMVAAAALKCASRYEENTVELDYDGLVILFYCLVNKTELCEADEQEFIAIKKSLITVDHIMQRKLEYIFSHRLAHQFMVPFLSFMLERNYRLASFHRSLSEATMKFANDLYTDPLCINYKPDHLAIACIHAALHVHGLLKQVDLLEPWFQAFSRDLTVSKLREIKIFLFRLYNGQKLTPVDLDLECEVVPPNGAEEEKVEAQEKPDQEILLMKEIDVKKLEKHQTKHVNKGKKKLGKRKHDGRSKKRHRGVSKRKRDENSSKCVVKNNPEDEYENKNDNEIKNKEMNLSENLNVEEIKSDRNKSKNNENEIDECKNILVVNEKCTEEDKKKQEDSDERVSKEGIGLPNRKIENSIDEGSHRRVENSDGRQDKESVETIGVIRKEHSSDKDVSTLDLELSVWAARFKAARESNCSVTDI